MDKYFKCPHCDFQYETKEWLEAIEMPMNLVCFKCEKTFKIYAKIKDIEWIIEKE